MRYAIIIFLFLCAAYSGAAQQEISFNGNTFTMSPVDTINVIDPVSGSAEILFEPPRPVSLNKEPIYRIDTLKILPAFRAGKTGEQKLSAWLFDHLKSTLDTLDDGKYILSVTNAVIDKKGRLVYYEFGGIKKLVTKTVFTTRAAVKPLNPDRLNLFVAGVNDTGLANTRSVTDNSTDIPANNFEGNDNASRDNKVYSREETAAIDSGIDEQTKNAINTAAKKLLEEMPAMKPAQLDHENVNCTGNVFSAWSCIVVRGHMALFTPFYDGL
jgi:hypothetical protein